LPSFGATELLYLAIGFASSLLGSVVGIGGGSIALPALLYLGIGVDIAVASSKAMVFANSATASVRYRSELAKRWKYVAASGTLMAVASYVGAYEVPRIPASVVRIIVSLAILAGGARILATRGKHAPSGRRRARTSLLLIASAVAGFVAGISGLGGGVVLLPALYAIGLDSVTCTAISVACIAIASTTALARHVADNLLRLDVALPLCLGAIAGGVLGPSVARRLSKRGLLKLLAGVTLVAVALRILAESLTELA